MCYKAEMQKRRIKVDIDSFSADKISRVAKWVCEDRKPGLLLYGTVGSGKTTMANALCELISITHDTGVVSTTKIIRRITAIDLAKLQGDNEEEFDRYKDADMLFIDDFGTEPRMIKNYGNDLTPMIDLLYHRYDKQKFTIMTSNLDDPMIRERYGERVADRITEMFDKISYNTKSYRQ